MKNQIELGLPIDAETFREELPEGFELHDDGQRYFEFDDTGFSLFVFTLGWVGSVSASVMTKIICDAIKKRSSKPAKRIIVNELHVEFDREKIARIIQRSIEIPDQTEDDDE